MMQTLKFSIEVEVGIPDHEYGVKIRNRFIKALIADTPERISFDELEKILCLSGLQYYVQSVDFAQKSPNDDESITKFVIKG
jgi:hypothetical protein